MSIKIVPTITISTKEWLTSYKERSIILIVEFFDKKKNESYINLTSLKFELFINSTKRAKIVIGYRYLYV